MPPRRRVLDDKGGPGRPATAGMVMTSSGGNPESARGWDGEAKKDSLGPHPRPRGEGDVGTKGRRGERGDPEEIKRSAADSEDCSKKLVAERLMTPAREFDRTWSESWRREQLRGLAVPPAGYGAEAGDDSSRQDPRCQGGLPGVHADSLSAPQRLVCDDIYGDIEDNGGNRIDQVGGEREFGHREASTWGQSSDQRRGSRIPRDGTLEVLGIVKISINSMKSICCQNKETKKEIVELGRDTH